MDIHTSLALTRDSAADDIAYPEYRRTFCFASRRAASVSAVSPLWLIKKTTSPSFDDRISVPKLRSIFHLHRNFPVRSSIRYSPISPACHDVPQAVIITPLSIFQYRQTPSQPAELRVSLFEQDSPAHRVPEGFRLLHDFL